ncbi:MAG: hypothetical protein O2971_01505 [Proteobacteria bacterium]|nr:hypothetical protein [Pseudomonadota bacterium]
MDIKKYAKKLAPVYASCISTMRVVPCLRHRIGTIQDHLVLEQEYGSFEAAENEQEKIQQFYVAFTQLFNCTPGGDRL